MLITPVSSSLNTNVSFTQKKKTPPLVNSNVVARNTIAPEYQREYFEIIKGANSTFKKQINLAHKLASKYVIYSNPSKKIAKVTYDHYFAAYLKSALDFALDVKDGKTTYEKEINSSMPVQLADVVCTAIWRCENIDGTIKVLKEELRKQMQYLEEKTQKNARVNFLDIDKSMIDVTSYILRTAAVAANSDINFLDVNDGFALSSMIMSDNRNDRKKASDFIQKLAMEVMTEKPKKQTPLLPYYSDISKNVIRNADKNFDIFVTYSKEDPKALEYFIRNLYDTLKSEDSFKDCKKINKDNIEMVAFNQISNFEVILNEIKAMAKNPDKQYVVLLQNFDMTVSNSAMKLENGVGTYTFDLNLLEDVFRKNKPKNVHYILMTNRDAYYNPVLRSEIFTKYTDEFQNIQIPIMDSKSTKKQLLLTKSEIEKEAGARLTEDALEYACDLIGDDASKYDKAIKLIKNVASYYVDKKELTKQEISLYWENLQQTDKATADNSYEIVFDTKTKLDDIIGSPMTKTQAKNAVYEIENFPKTKGYVLYNVDGQGGGRLKTAKAIAGEAKIPMVKISASDFAIRELDTVNMNPMAAIETKMTKLINLIKTQAQANPNKTVMLFISDFDRFSSNPLYGISSIYEQQAFKKLQQEMKKSYEDGSYNIIVMGASEMPELMSENLNRPGLFMDSIAVYPPRIKQGVIEVALNHAQKNNYKIEGETEEEKQKVLKHFSSITLGMSYVDIVDIIDKANILSKKDGRDSIKIEDINEAFLTKITGTTSQVVLDDKHKEVIIRHEGGHALNLQFMYNLLKEKNDTLKIPDVVQCIALDPRGDFLGCVFHDTSDENPTEANLETILSSIICSFGGNSTEEHFYDMSGSIGISQDMQNANYFAKLAVLRMGLGKKSGYYIPDIDPQTGKPMFACDDGKNYVSDAKVFLKNAKTASDKIVSCYEGFLKEFSKNNISKFATGKCILTGEEFAKSLKDWENKQPQAKKKEIENLKKEIEAIITYTKKGRIYGPLSKYNPKYRTN